MKTNFVLLPMPRSFCFTGGEVSRGKLSFVNAVIDSSKGMCAEGYELYITDSGVEIKAADAPGVFYARQTLKQIVDQISDEENCPTLKILDYPEFKMRYYSLDVSRDRTPKLEDLLSFIDQLASWKVNCLSLYFEHVFAYRNHEEVWHDTAYFTAEDIRAIDVYCKERFIDLIPKQNTLAHMHRWLCHDTYRHLAECPQGAPSSWSMSDTDPASLCPADPASLKFVESLLDELLPNFSSKLFNGICDESFDIGSGRSRELLPGKGRAELYIDYVNSLSAAVKKRGKTMIIAGDIIKLHSDLYKRISPNIIVGEWEYGRNAAFEENGRRLKELGIPFLIETSNSNYSSLGGRTYRWRGNISNGAFAAMKTGAMGLSVNEFGDFGHWYNWSFSHPGNAYAAAMMWAPVQNEHIDMAEALDLFIYGKESGAADIIMDLGKIYRHVAAEDDGDALFLMLHENKSGKDASYFINVSLDRLLCMKEDIEQIEYRLKRLPLITGFVREEITQSIAYQRFAIHCAEEFLRDESANHLSLLNAATQKQLAREFGEVIRNMVSIRDRQYQAGGRNAAIFWLKQSWKLVCGNEPFPL